MNEQADERSGDLLARWRNGDQQAADALFRRYADRLVALARSRLSRKVSQRVDPEDVVQSVYRSFFADTRDGRYELQRGGDLWRLLVTITLYKLRDQTKHNARAKRTVEREQTFGTEDSLLGIQPQVLAQAPTPLEAVLLADEVERAMRQLVPLQRRTLELRLQGYDVAEIAADLRCSERTVSRFLKRIKAVLQPGQPGNSP
ncbi:hypothetical protein AYO44_13935 [Planctomycetaceae bacterium SCGC AG-212-F19]|nr:hypothetical protein AYO44_13935 [Planctomycetaceae bacterium SCGC AG-212-F19]